MGLRSIVTPRHRYFETTLRCCSLLPSLDQNELRLVWGEIFGARRRHEHFFFHINNVGTAFERRIADQLGGGESF